MGTVVHHIIFSTTSRCYFEGTTETTYVIVGRNFFLAIIKINSYELSKLDCNELRNFLNTKILLLSPHLHGPLFLHKNNICKMKIM